jgi:lactate 2-monooxygenase
MTFAEYQDKLYTRGQTGFQPQYPAGAGDKHTQPANCEAFQRRLLSPRLVARVERDMSIELSGKLPAPLFCLVR